VKPEVAQYVIRYYHYLMTFDEMAANKYLHATMKATQGRSDAAAQEEARGRTSFRIATNRSLEVMALAKDGYDIFTVRTAERIVAENKNRVILNYCPRCHELARTPRAKQCRFCGHDWHDTQ
jgi:formylmethanofuran dehydrogenase subunit E